MPDADATKSASSPAESDFLAHTDELVSFYDESFHLVDCSPKLRKAYAVDSLVEATLWHVYPELLAPRPKAAVDFVVASGIPRSIEITDARGRVQRTLVVFRVERGIGVAEAESDSTCRAAASSGTSASRRPRRARAIVRCCFTRRPMTS